MDPIYKIVIVLVSLILLINGVVRNKWFYRVEAILFFCWILFELCCFKLLPLSILRHTDQFSGTTTRPDYYYGQRLRSNVDVNHLRTIGKDTLFHVTYHLDSLGQRSCPNTFTGENHFLVFGSEDQFGIGQDCPVFDDLEKYTIYNFAGFHTDVLFLMANMDSLSLPVEESVGELHYFVSKIDLEAIVGSRQYILERGSKSPYFELKENDWKRESNMFEGRSLETNFYRLINRLPSVRLYQPKCYTNEFKEAQLEKALLICKRKYLRRFPKGKFIVHSPFE